ncbi:MAG TPA: flagellar hook assembly protein FlgD [Alphaproteobacteria bacterium]
MSTIGATQTATSATNATATTATNPSANSALAQFSSNFDQFLTLLTAQLQHQDPLSPMDSTQFTSQLVQFTGVEQGILQNQNLKQLITMQSNTQMASSVQYIGKTINQAGNQVVLSGSSGTIDYSVTDTSTKKVNITITDTSGTVIRTAAVDSPSSGQNVFHWDGRNNTGSVVPDGTYNVKIQGFNSQNNPVTVAAGGNGIVSDVSLVNGNLILTTQSGVQVPISDVSSVH